MKYFILCLLINFQIFAAQENIKGLLPEVKLDSDNEETNMKKSFNSEVLITKSENKAIKSLIKIIESNKNKKEEVDFLFRLAELYMRRAKSGRFFDLDKNSDIHLQQHGINKQKTKESLTQAIKIYDQIRNRFPNYQDLDFVLFNSALAQLQIKETEKAKKLYSQLISNYPSSSLIPDALLELGEIHYNQRDYSLALDVLKKLEKYPKSRAYSYGLYKSAWCYYNLKNTTDAINQLLTVVKENPVNSSDTKKYNLRNEALRDLTLFTGESLAANEIFSFFENITTEDELGEIIISLASLYESHSRYKEISVFTKQFINRYPQNKQAPKCYNKLIETNETLKQRPLVIENLIEMSKFCKNEKTDTSCFSEFRKTSLEISKKWWDIWLKNKTNLEFSLLTEKAFEVLLSNEEVSKPDSKSRFAFAELLFQQEKYEQASQNYEIVSQHLSIDTTLTHDSLYGAIFAIEKILSKKETKEMIEKQKNLSLRYIKEFNNGEHSIEIQYKIGFIAYKQSNYELALKYIKPLLNNNKYEEIRIKSEDLILDIYNIQKDYMSIQSLAKNIIAKPLLTDRKTLLKKIIEEAHYSQVQIDMKNLPIQKQIDLLVDFAKNHTDTKLGQDAYWQSVSMAYSAGYDTLGATLSTSYIKEYPNDERKGDALKDALKAHLDSGNIKSAISVLKNLAEIDIKDQRVHSELICDLLKIDHQMLESRKCYKSLFSNIENNKKSSLIGKILQTFKNEDSNEYEEIEKQILFSDIEPFSTEILTKRAKQLFEQKNYTQAFNLSLKINARPVDSTFRAESRLLQAQILENEFNTQSVKAQENKLALVISMKTEKLDKAFTAFSSVIKMTKSSKIQLQALKGIDRLYTHFISSLTNLTPPDTLSATDKEELKKELAKVTQPFSEKKNVNLEQINLISKTTISEKKSIVWNELALDQTVEPQIKQLDIQRAPPLYSDDQASLTIKNLIEKRKLNEAEAEALNLTARREQRLLGLYYLSVIADTKEEYDKSIWFLERASTLLKDADIKIQDFVNYQKAKMFYTVEDFDNAFIFFEKVLTIKDSLPQINALFALKAFSKEDYIKTNKELSRLSPTQIYNYGMDILHIESVLKQGNTPQAAKLAKEYSEQFPNRIEIILEQARISEHLPSNQGESLKYYQKALVLSKDSEQQQWLKKKIEYIKINQNNQITSYVGGQ